jgi:flagellin
LAALGFAEVQTAVDTTYAAYITDAHSGRIVASGLKFSGNTLIGALNNVDITMGTNFAIKADGRGTMSGGYGTFDFINSSDSFIVHIASYSTILQIGANEGEILALSFGNTSSLALGLKGVSVVSREAAARSITLIDNASDRVSSMRAKLGAYQNRLEHTINNLTVAATNLKASESRIRDADMAREMIEFTKLNILLKSGISMAMQANQLPQAVLNLVR